MPAIAVKGAVIVVTVVAATCVAIYESPEVRQFAENCRRRIAVALHSLGDEINPPLRSASQEPRFNRPEDADGFLQSSAQPGVDADEDSKRRQREELMYWNQIRLQKLEAKARTEENRTRGSNFDDFLHEDPAADKGTYIYNSGAQVLGDTEGVLHRRSEAVRGLDRGVAYANPFSDENYIELEAQRSTDATLMAPERSEMSEDIYGVEEGYKSCRESTRTLDHEEQLVDFSEDASVPVSELVSSSLPAELGTNSQHQDAYIQNAEGQSAWASVHAWADSTSGHGHDASFYSPLPVTPQTVTSEPELLSGQATPTDSASLIGSSEDFADNASSVNDDGIHYDVMSEDGDGMHTPGSWTEVGSIVSENDAEHEHVAHA